MKIVIVGGGKVGDLLCQELSDSSDIVLIDKNPKVIDHFFSLYDIQAVVGNGADVKILEEATVAESEVFISITDSDELNIIACIIAKKIGAKYTIARVRSPEYREGLEYISSSLGITSMINPDEESATEISRILKFPTALSIESFADDKVKIVEIMVEQDSPLLGMTLKQFRDSFNGRLLVCIVERGTEVIIPTGSTEIRAEDIIFVTGSNEDLERFYSEVKINGKPIKSALVIGGGRISYYLMKKLISNSVSVKLIELNEVKAQQISDEYPQITVINSDGTDQDVLELEGIDCHDACISLTGIDEENLIISLFAKTKGVRKCIAKVSRTSIIKILGHVGLDTVITPKRLIADKIIRFVRSLGNSGGSGIEKLYTLANGTVEAIEFIASSHASMLGIPLSELELKPNTLVALILRGNTHIYPSGQDSILRGDRVIIVTTQNNLQDLNDIILE